MHEHRMQFLLDRVDLYLSGGLFQSLLLSSCDVDGGSGLRELESDSFADTSGGTCYYTHPTGQGHFSRRETTQQHVVMETFNINWTYQS